MKEETGKENNLKQKTVRRSSDDVVENVARNSNPDIPDSSARFSFGTFRDGVSDFLRRIHWQPSTPEKNSNTSLDSHHESRKSQRKLKSKGQSRQVSASKTKANFIQLAENIKKEERRKKRRRRSSRTKSSERRVRDVEYFSGRHLEERRSRTPRNTFSEEFKDQEQVHASQAPDHVPYGDTRSCNNSRQGIVLPTISEGEVVFTGREKISEGEIASVRAQPSDGEVIQIPNKNHKKSSHAPQENLTSQSRLRRKKKRREEHRLTLRTKKKENVNESGEKEKPTRREKLVKEAVQEQEHEHGLGIHPTSITRLSHQRHSTKNIEETSDTKRKIERKEIITSSQKLELSQLRSDKTSTSRGNLNIEAQKKPSQTLQSPTGSPSTENRLESSTIPMDFYLRTPAQILAENHLDINYGDRYRSYLAPDKTTPARQTLIPVLPPQIGLEPKKSRLPPPIPPLILDDIDLHEHKANTYSSSISSLNRTKAKSEALLNVFKRMFHGGGKKKLKYRKEMDAKMKAARKNKGPFWRIEVFERNRAKNRGANKTYAVVFGCGYKNENIRRRKVKLMDNLVNFAKTTRASKLFKKNKLVEKDDESEFTTYGAALNDEFRLKNLPDFLDEFSKGTVNNRYTDPKMKYIHHVLTRPISFDKTNITSDSSKVEIPKVLDFSHLLNPAKSQSLPNPPSLPQYDFLDRINNNSKSLTSTGFDISSILPHSTSFPTLARSTNKSFLKNYTSPVTSLLQDSSKVSEKTQVLLQAARVTSASKLPFHMNSSDPMNSKGKLFDENTLTKIYTPKTDFTRQFASLLPSYNQDKSYGDFARYF